MFTMGINNATALRLARYQAQALQAIDASSARIASDRRFTTFAEDTVSATREVSLRAQQGATALYLRTTQDAAAAADAASSGLQSASDILIELRNAVVGLNDSDPEVVTATQRTVDQLTKELTRIGETTTAAGGKNLLDGSIASTPLTFKVASTSTASNEVGLTAIAVDAAQLGSNTLKLDEISFTSGTPTTLDDALAAIDDAQVAVSASLASTASISSAMSYHANALGAQATSLGATLDNLVSVDVAQETIDLTRSRLRAEAATAMLAQVNALHASMVQQLLMSR
jgi:flagellin